MLLKFDFYTYTQNNYAIFILTTSEHIMRTNWKTNNPYQGNYNFNECIARKHVTLDVFKYSCS